MIPRMRRTPLSTVVICLVLTVGLLTACSSTNSTNTTASGSSAPPIPATAFHDRTGVTSTSVTIGNVSTQVAGLFTGAVVGTKAYAAYVNSQGGVHGRKIVVSSADDRFQGAINKDDVQSVVQSDFASVGGLSLEDSFSEPLIAAHPGFPDITASLDPATEKLPNNFSPTPASNGWPTGPLLYFKQKYPTKIAHAGTIIADLPSTELAWANEKKAMQHLGYTVLYDPALPPSTTDFTAQVVAMKSAGVQILFLEQEPQNYASAIFRDLDEQNFHPVVVLGAASYSPQLVGNAGGTQARSTGPIWSRQHRSTWARTRLRFRPSPPSRTGSRRSHPGSPPTSSPWPGGCAPSCSSTPCARPVRTRPAARSCRPCGRSRPSTVGTSPR